MKGLRPPPEGTVTKRIELLLAISDALIQFETVEEVTPVVLDAVSKAVPLRTAVSRPPAENAEMIEG
jgi:hypothetical protein